MGQFSSFDGLPIVVHDGILRSLASPRDVANLIRASPGSLQAYMTGGRKSVLVAAMRNFLSLENQHLMNLVISAPHYSNVGQVPLEKCCIRTATATNVALDGVTSRDDFNEAVRCYLQSFHCRDLVCLNHELQHLTLNTLDSSITLFAVMDKAIQTYSAFTMARAKGRVGRMCGPQTLMSLSTDCRQSAPDDRETQRVWRGFLLYELFCIIWGIPQLIEVASNSWSDRTERELVPILDSFYDMPAEELEELLSVRQYVLEQYGLQVNQVVERFRLTVHQLRGRLSSTDPSNPSRHNRSPSSISKLKTEPPPDALRYLVKDCSFVQIHRLEDQTTWIESMALLGTSFLQDFLSRDATARLDFVRATFLHFDHRLIRPSHPLFTSREKLYSLAQKHLGLGRAPYDINDCMMLRLRAVGWIFWDNPDRLLSMSLDPRRRYAAYGRRAASHIPSRLDYPASDGVYLDETSKKLEYWEPLVREFGILLTQGQHEEIDRLFRSVGSLRFDDVTSVATGSRESTEGGDGTEVSHSDD